jgi:hypothetical protein
MVWQESHGLIDLKEQQDSFMTTREHGSTHGARTVLSKYKA